MIGYKYRANIRHDGVERDINSLIQHELYAPLYKDLNDPFETMCNEAISNILETVQKLFGVDTTNIKSKLDNILIHKEKAGIYSLCTNYTNELLWSHYANAHKGFCIEYDIEKLVQKYLISRSVNQFQVKYKDKIPTLEIEDIKNSNIFLQKLLGTKSLSWKYEDEIRIIYDDFGIKQYHPSALTGIYFGLATDDNTQEKIILGLKDYDVKFYKMQLVKNTYKLERKLIHENHREITNKLSANSYEILMTNHNPSVENFHVFYKNKDFTKDTLVEFIKRFRNEYSTRQSNVSLYDTNTIKSLIPINNLQGKELDLYTQHYIALSTFDAPNDIFMYPYK